MPAELECSNRMLRQLSPEMLIRVTFADENLGRLSQATQSLSRDIQKRMRAVLRTGILLCGRHFVFLSFSTSQLKQHGCWFYASDGPLTADAVRASLGDFSSIGIAGKCPFATTPPSPATCLRIAARGSTAAAAAAIRTGMRRAWDSASRTRGLAHGRCIQASGKGFRTLFATGIPSLTAWARSRPAS